VRKATWCTLPTPHIPRRASGVARTSTDAPRAAAGDGVARPRAVGAVLGGEAGEAQAGAEEAGGRAEVAGVEAHGVQPAHLVLRRDRARVPRDERAPVAVRRLDEREAQAVRVGEGERVLAEARFARAGRDAQRRQPLLPVAERPGRHGQRDGGGQPVAGAPVRHVGPREEGQLRPRRPGAVGEEEVVGVGRVLVDGALDEPHPQPGDVEVERLLRVARDDGDVVQAGDRRHVDSGCGLFISVVR
jgi:hypothetical protein